MPSLSPLPTQFAPAERATPEQLQQQRDRFRQLPDLLRQFLDSIPHIVLVLNAQRQTVFANRMLLDLLGLESVDSLLGQRPGELLDCVHAAENLAGCGTTEFCRMCGAVRAILSSLGGKESVRECRILQSNGTALDLLVQASPLVLDGQRYSIFTVQDISHEKRREALERIFFHDLLNTAQILVGYAEVLSEGEVSKEVIALMHRVSLRLVDEIQAQRDLILAESGDLAVRPVPIESLRLLEDLKTSYERSSLADQRSLRIAPDAQAVTLTSDPTLLGRVIGNLVKNALEASDPGQTVTLSCYPDDGSAVFTVHNAAFIPRDIQLQIFQRSFSTKGTGRGLGTYSVRLLTERYLGGRVDFATSPGGGTTFTVAVPLALSPAADAGPGR